MRSRHTDVAVFGGRVCSLGSFGILVGKYTLRGCYVAILVIRSSSKSDNCDRCRRGAAFTASRFCGIGFTV